MFIIEFSYNFLYVWNCMKLYDKKFLIYGNCMIRSFGQPGLTTSILKEVTGCAIEHKSLKKERFVKCICINCWNLF